MSFDKKRQCQYCGGKMGLYKKDDFYAIFFCEDFCSNKAYTIISHECINTQMVRHGTTIRNQCTSCGDLIGNAISTKTTDISKLKDSSLLFDKERHKKQYDFYQKFIDGFLIKCEEKRQNKDTQWFRWYGEYLRSKEWKNKRQMVLNRDSFICQGCLSKKATQVHHLSYAHVGNEPLFELVSLCENCHNSITEMDKKE